MLPVKLPVAPPLPFSSSTPAPVLVMAPEPTIPTETVPDVAATPPIVPVPAMAPPATVTSLAMAKTPKVRVPPVLTVTAPPPSALALPNVIPPALMTVPPVNEPAAESVKTPTPDFTIARLFSLVPSPPSLPANVVAAAKFHVRVELAVFPPTIALLAFEVVLSPIVCADVPAASPKTNLPSLAKLKSMVAPMRLFPPARMTAPPWTFMRPVSVVELSPVNLIDPEPFL